MSLILTLFCVVVTKEYQVGSAHINGKLYLFVDTPGLNDVEVSNESILEEIAKLLDITKNSVTYAGVLYVHPATLQFSKEVKQSLQFLALFCGPDYFPQITFVTTFWDDIAPSQIEAKDELIGELAQYKWPSFLSRGAEVYHHGRVYEGGKPTLDTLSLDDHPELRQIQAREAIARLYPVDRVYAAPMIIMELRAMIPLEDTRVGQFARKISEGFYGARQASASHGRPLMLGQSEPSGVWCDRCSNQVPIRKGGCFSRGSFGPCHSPQSRNYENDARITDHRVSAISKWSWCRSSVHNCRRDQFHGWIWNLWSIHGTLSFSRPIIQLQYRLA